MIVEHPKIRTLLPDWQPFHGYSLILESHTGTPAAPGSAVFTDRPGTLAAFHAIDTAIRAVGRDRLMRAMLLCLLPPESYHVTAVDLINPTDGARVHDTARPAVDQALALCASRDPQALPGVLQDIGLVIGRNRNCPIRFAAVGLNTLGGRVVALEVKPAHPEDATAFADLCDWRTRVQEDLQRTTGLRPKPWTPHITLGYFANARFGNEDPAALKELEQRLEEGLKDILFEFDAVTLYGFASMAEYWRTGLSV